MAKNAKAAGRVFLFGAVFFVHKALSDLTTDYRSILWLVFFEGFSGKEAATVLKKSERQIKNLLYRAKQSLKDIYLGKAGEFKIISVPYRNTILHSEDEVWNVKNDDTKLLIKKSDGKTIVFCVQ